MLLRGYSFTGITVRVAKDEEGENCGSPNQINLNTSIENAFMLF